MMYVTMYSHLNDSLMDNLANASSWLHCVDYLTTCSIKLRVCVII